MLFKIMALPKSVIYMFLNDLLRRPVRVITGKLEEETFKKQTCETCPIIFVIFSQIQKVEKSILIKLRF